MREIQVAVIVKAQAHTRADIKKAIAAGVKTVAEFNEFMGGV